MKEFESELVKKIIKGETCDIRELLEEIRRLSMLRNELTIQLETLYGHVGGMNSKN